VSRVSDSALPWACRRRQPSCCRSRWRWHYERSRQMRRGRFPSWRRPSGSCCWPPEWIWHSCWRRRQRASCSCPSEPQPQPQPQPPRESEWWCRQSRRARHAERARRQRRLGEEMEGKRERNGCENPRVEGQQIKNKRILVMNQATTNGEMIKTRSTEIDIEKHTRKGSLRHIANKMYVWTGINQTLHSIDAKCLHFTSATATGGG
jgi:hypothetical protein